MRNDEAAEDRLDPTPAGDPSAEDERLAALDRYDILDTPREESFDRVTRLAKKIFRVPMVSMTLVDGHRQWFKSQQGMKDAETPRGPSFCNVAMRCDAPLVVEDAREDPRFSGNVFVTGDPHIRFYAGVPLKSPEGHSLGTLCVLDRSPREFGAEDVETLTELAHIVMDEMELRLRANTDALTGALSRRAFREEAGRALHLARRRGQELSLVVFDLDDFKQVNDAYGHPVGDAVLTRSAKVSSGVLRGSDAIGRLGGEEFAVLMPQTGAREAMEVAERLRAEIAAARYGAGGGAFKVTASFGVATSARETGDIDALIAEADGALYLAKAQGRNRCVAARPVDPAAEAETRALRRVLKGGRILFNRGAATRECTVKGLGDTGATIDVSTTDGLPDRFELKIEGEVATRVCRIVSASDRRIEVAFA